MKLLLLLPIILTLVFASTSIAYAQEYSANTPTATIIVAAPNSAVSGCEDIKNGCYSPSIAHVTTGGVVIFKNTDTAIHTFTS